MDKKLLDVIQNIIMRITLLPEEVGKWNDETFPHSTPNSIINHLKREIKELEENNSDPNEIADCVLLLMHLAHKHNHRFYKIVLDKFEEVQKRNWGPPDKEGVSEHIKE